MEALRKIQQGLSVAKANYNEFGGYNYRTLEDMLEAVKPLLSETETTLHFTDEVVEIGNRVYVRATVTLSGKSGSICATAYAREPLTKKKMDDSQLTGMASTYARKYAMSGLFCINEVRDADSMDNTEEAPAKMTLHPNGDGVTTTTNGTYRKVVQGIIQGRAKIEDMEQYYNVTADVLERLEADVTGYQSGVDLLN